MVLGRQRNQPRSSGAPSVDRARVCTEVPSRRLYDALKEMRLARARLLEKPAFTVFSDKVLDAIVAARPTTAAQLLSVQGIGPQKVAEMGEAILNMCNNRGFAGGGSQRPSGTLAQAEIRLPNSSAERVTSHALADHLQLKRQRLFPPSPHKALEMRSPPEQSGSSGGTSSAMPSLHEALKKLRTEQAREKEIPAYCVFSNETMDAIVAARPTTDQQLLSIKGIGPQKLAEIGGKILRLCNNCALVGGSQRPSGAPARTELELAKVHASPDHQVLKRQKLEHGQHSPCVAVEVASQPAPNMADKIETVDLTHEQQRAALRAFRRESLFLTGAAGVGKSFLLRHIIHRLQDGAQHANHVAVTAPTGIAASHIGGTTIHSFAGIGLGKGGVEKLVHKVEQNAAASARWKACKVLVIDEVSMLDSELFEALEQIARRVRGVSAPFGGIQLLLCGDFYQLPPVSLNARGVGFAFESAAWRRCAVATVLLRQQVRQSGDAAFAAMLNEVRLGLCSAATTAALMACHVRGKALPSDGIIPTKLYCKNAAVDEENAHFLAALPGHAHTFTAADRFHGGQPTEEVGRRLAGMVEKKAVASLRLKVGAQVMLSRNWPDAKLVNGSRGVVVAFVEERESGKPVLCPRVRFDSGATVTVHRSSFFQGGPGGAIVRDQVPLKLAWALTVHKSQGMTLSRVALQLDDAFDFGQTYVALSRARSLAGLWVQGGAVTQAAVKAHPAVTAFYRESGGALL